MFRAEERHHLHPGRTGKNFSRAAALRIEPRVIGDQPDVFAAKRRELLCFENIEPGLHARCTACAFGRRLGWRRDNRGQRQNNHERKEDSKRALVSGQMVPLYSNHTMIFWNALAAVALRTRCACAMYKCRRRAALGDSNRWKVAASAFCS